MKLLFVDQFSDLGGAQLCLCDVLAEARRRGWKPLVMAPGTGRLKAFCEDWGIPFHSLPTGRYRNGGKSVRDVMRYGLDMARSAAAIRAIARREAPDAIYVNGPRVLPAAAAACCPLVFHAHSFLDKRYSRQIATRFLRLKNATMIASSRFVAEPLKGSAASYVTIYNGVVDHGYVPRPFARRPPRVGIIGRIAPEKGHLDFAEAAKAIAAIRADVRFPVYGAGLFSDPGYDNAVRSAARDAPVEFHGWTDDIGRALHEIDILTVPSSEVDATPRVIMEAFSAGTPVIAYPSGGIPELIRAGETGILTRSLARSIEDLLTNREFMARLSAAGRREWEARFRVQRFQRDICDLLEGLAEKGRKAETSAAIA